MSQFLPSPQSADLSRLASLPNRSLQALESRIRGLLAESGFASQSEASAYLRYLENLMAGTHEPQALTGLSLTALQQAPRVLLSWRAWLQQEFGQDTPESCDHLALACLAHLQALIEEKTNEHKALEAILPGPSELPEILEECLSHTKQERVLALLQIEFPRHLPLAPERLLPEAVIILGQVLREHDALFMIDRHTIGLLLANMAGVGHAMLAANRVHSCFELPMDIEGLTIRLHPRLGLALYPDHAHSPDELLAAAAIATHNFASDGVGIYEPERDRLGQLLQRLEIPVREALDENRFHLALQPQVSQDGRALHGMEALLRWTDDRLGKVPPSEIVMVAEHLGLMGPLTHWVIQAGLREFRNLLVQNIPGSISINLAPESLYDHNLPDIIANALAVWHVPGERVVFEITESAVIENLDLAVQSLNRLKAMGCRLALDDFGTGYSSLNYMKMLPIDELKIDASFIRNLKNSPKDASIVHAVIDLAHRLNLIVICEGVEDAETADLLTEAHNDVIQGYYYSQPLTPAQIPDFVKNLAGRFPV